MFTCLLFALSEERSRVRVKRHHHAQEVPVSNGRGDDIFNQAISKIGCPYVWGGAGPNAFDCSGLTWWCHRQCGINIPRIASDQQAHGIPTNGMRGDICCFGNPAYHVGLCDGVGNYIHAPTTGQNVKWSNWWNGCTGFRRYW